MAPEPSDATPCSCAGMQLFSSPLDPSDLKKSAEVALSRSLPTNPDDIANQINGVRDDSLKKAQEAMVSVSLTQQKFDALPDFVKSQPQVVALNSQLTTMQTDLGIRTAAVYGLGQHLTANEENKKILLSQKARMEATAAGNVGAITQNQLAQTTEFQAVQNELTYVKGQYASAQDNYASAKTNLDTNIAAQKAQLDDLGAQVTDLQARQNELLAEKKRLEEEMKAQQAALQDQVQDQLNQSPDYQTIQGQLSALDSQYVSLRAQYQAASKYLTQVLPSVLTMLPGFLTNLSIILEPLLLRIPFVADILPKAQMVGRVLDEWAAEAYKAYTGVSKILNMQQLPQTPSMPAFPALRAIPQLIGLPEIPPFPSDLDWIKLPPGLFATPELPAMPAFPGLPEGLPEVPATLLDGSFDSLVESAEADVLNQARAAAGAQGISLEAVQEYFPSSLTEKAKDIKSALTKTAKGYMTPYLEAIPPLPARPELPPFPSTADLTGFAGMYIPTKESLLEHGSSLAPKEYDFFSAVWTNIEAKQAVAQRAGDTIKERTADFQGRVMNLVGAQNAASAENMPLAQYLQKASGTNPIYDALANQQVPDFMKKFSTLPETPLLCKQNCSNVGIRNLFPDVTNPTQMDVAGMFANAKELVSTNTMNVLSVGESSADFVKGHIANLEARVKEAGGKTATLLTADINNAINSASGMIALEDKLKGVSILTLSDMKDLSPQASALVSEISQKMSASVPVLMTTPSIGTLSTDPTVNSAMISQLAPGGSTIDARKPDEVPQTSVYTPISDSDSKITAMFRVRT